MELWTKHITAAMKRLAPITFVLAAGGLLWHRR